MKKTNLKRVTAFAMIAMMCVSLAGCGSSAGTADTTAAPKGETAKAEENKAEAAQESGKYATSMTYAVGSECQHFDPAHADASADSKVMAQLYYPLFVIGENGEMENEACKEYEVSDDGLVYTLHLIDNNYWSDGEKCTAEHYVYGMKRAIGMGTADSYYSYFLSDYVENAKEHGVNMDDVADMDDVGIKALDENTIEIKLTAPCPYFLSLMSSNVFFPLRPDLVPEHDFTWADDPSFPTNGAFYPVKIDRTSEVVMKKNPYFAHADQVVIEDLTAKIMPDMDSQLMAFQTGEIDFTDSLNSEVTKIYAGKSELMICDSVVNCTVVFNAYSKENAAVTNPVVRRALSLAIDRTALVEALDADVLFYELYGFVPKGFDGINGDFREEQDASDPLVYTDKEEAKALLAQEGFNESNPLKLTYSYNQNNRNDTVAEVLKAQWAEIGVELMLVTEEGRTFFDNRDNGFYESARLASSADWMDPCAYLNIGTTSIHDVVTYGDETYDAMMAEASTMSGDERMQKLHDAEEYLIRDMSYFCPLFGSRDAILAKAGLTGHRSNPQAGHFHWYDKIPVE